jgi:hypothetical protein
MGEDDIRRN